MSDENEMPPDELDARIQAMQAEQEPEPTQEAAEPVEATEDTPEPTDATEAAPKAEDDDAEARIQRLYYESRDAKRRAKALQEENEALKGQRPQSHDEVVTREAYTMAQELAAQQTWVSETNRIVEAGRREIKGFDDQLNKLAANFPEHGGVPREITEAAMAERGHEHKIIAFYAANPDLAEQLLDMTPLQRGAAVARIATKIMAPKPVSKAPTPIRPVAGAATAVQAPKDISKMSTAEQIAYYDQEDLNARKARGY